MLDNFSGVVIKIAYTPLALMEYLVLNLVTMLSGCSINP